MNDEKKLDLIGYGVYMGSRWSKHNTIDELEKIKAEIINCFSQENDIDSDPYNHALDIAISIVHDHISELKGENNDENKTDN